VHVSFPDCKPIVDNIAAHIKEVLPGLMRDPRKTEALLAFVLTINQSSPRADTTIHILLDLGFHVIPVTPPPLNTQFISTGVCSNRFAHLTAIEYFAMLPLHLKYGWFFEDDLALASPLEESKLILYEIIQNPHQPTPGVIYLGACGVQSSADPLVYSVDPPVEYAVGSFSCAHAYGLSFNLSQNFRHMITKDIQQKRCGSDNYGFERLSYFDQLLLEFSHQQPAFVVGAQYVSPQFPDHRGIFYQDRKQFPSQIDQFWKVRKL
jgi:hypothetical protein